MAPAVTVFIASLTEEPIIGIMLAVANFIVRKETLSFAAARDPLSEMSATDNEKINTAKLTNVFFSAFVIPMGLVKACSTNMNETIISERG